MISPSLPGVVPIWVLPDKLGNLIKAVKNFRTGRHNTMCIAQWKATYAHCGAAWRVGSP